MALGDENDEEEDEETLQLKLEAIQARLKLKKLQSKKAQASPAKVDHSLQDRERLKPPESRATHDRDAGAPDRRRPRSQPRDVQVPLSPERRPPAQEQKSPSRVLMGIDKGLSARSVSLRRAPSLRVDPIPLDDPFNDHSRARSRQDGRTSRVGDDANGLSGIKSFNDRIAESRQQDRKDRERREKREALRKNRSKGFGVDQEEIERFKRASGEAPATHGSIPGKTAERRAFSRDEVMHAYNKPGGLARSNTFSSQGDRNHRERATNGSGETVSRPKSAASQPSFSTKETTSRHPSDDTSEDRSQSATAAGDPALYEGFSSTNLSHRALPHSFLTRTLEGKTPLLIPDLLRDVKAPDFSLPPAVEENDYVVFGIVASKSDPISHKDPRKAPPAPDPATTTAQQEADASHANVGGNYLALTLTDLAWSVDLFLFASAFPRYRKLAPGTLIAVLNPSIMPPKPHLRAAGRWALTLHSADDTVLEVGTAKDLGWCRATKRDGKPCPAWVDARKTEYCEFHVDRQVEQMRRGRMETQGTGGLFAPGGKTAPRSGFFGSGSGRGRGGGGGGGGGKHHGGNGRARDDGLLKEGKQVDRAHGTYFMVPASATSLPNLDHFAAPGRRAATAAKLLDTLDDDRTAGALRGLTRAERTRRALAERERERAVARALADSGAGSGAEYLRAARAGERPAAGGSKAAPGGTGDEKGVSLAAEIGAAGRSASGVRLGPVQAKRKRGEEDSASGVGEGARGAGAEKKKTRFVTAKGIREAGRDSLGTAGAAEEDDGLDIV